VAVFDGRDSQGAGGGFQMDSRQTITNPGTAFLKNWRDVEFIKLFDLAKLLQIANARFQNARWRVMSFYEYPDSDFCVSIEPSES
jgi:hypothetical protein